MTACTLPDASAYLAEMTDAQLNLATARLMGLVIEDEKQMYINTMEGPIVYSPLTCLAQASDLIPRFGLNLRCLSMSRPGGRNEWGAWQGTELVDESEMVVAETPQKALVLAALSKIQLI